MTSNAECIKPLDLVQTHVTPTAWPGSDTRSYQWVDFSPPFGCQRPWEKRRACHTVSVWCHVYYHSDKFTATLVWGDPKCPGDDDDAAQHGTVHRSLLFLLLFVSRNTSLAKRRDAPTEEDAGRGREAQTQSLGSQTRWQLGLPFVFLLSLVVPSQRRWMGLPMAEYKLGRDHGSHISQKLLSSEKESWNIKAKRA